jgi:4-oxalocrotonate tautomerase
MPVIEITMSQGRSIEQKRELVKIFTKKAARILEINESSIRILIYKLSNENWGDSGVLGLDMKRP